MLPTVATTLVECATVHVIWKKEGIIMNEIDAKHFDVAD
jgi:hypothetical protein